MYLLYIINTQWWGNKKAFLNLQWFVAVTPVQPAQAVQTAGFHPLCSFRQHIHVHRTLEQGVEWFQDQGKRWLLEREKIIYCIKEAQNTSDTGISSLLRLLSPLSFAFILRKEKSLAYKLNKWRREGKCFMTQNRMQRRYLSLLGGSLALSVKYICPRGSE